MTEHTIIDQWKPIRCKHSAVFNSRFTHWTSIGISVSRERQPDLLFLKRYWYFLNFVKMLSSRSPKATQEITAQLRKSKINDENEVKKHLALKYKIFFVSRRVYVNNLRWCKINIIDCIVCCEFSFILLLIYNCKFNDKERNWTTKNWFVGIWVIDWDSHKI